MTQFISFSELENLIKKEEIKECYIYYNLDILYIPNATIKIEDKYGNINIIKVYIKNNIIYPINQEYKSIQYISPKCNILEKNFLLERFKYILSNNKPIICIYNHWNKVITDTIFTKEFINLTYENKANLLRNGKDNIDIKLLYRKQWPYNTLKYALMEGYNVVYIQVNDKYYNRPSIFAEAMYGILYTNMNNIENRIVHLDGPQNELFCTGDMDIIREINNIINIEMITLHSDYEWFNMTSSFIKDFYNNYKENDVTWMRFPWKKIYPNINRIIQPIKIRFITNILSLPDKEYTVTYINDINNIIKGYNIQLDSIIYNIDKSKYLPSFNGLALIYIISNINIVNTIYIVLNNSKDINIGDIDIVFDKTIREPKIVLPGGNIIETNDIKNICGN